MLIESFQTIDFWNLSHGLTDLIYYVDSGKQVQTILTNVEELTTSQVRHGIQISV